MDVKGIIRSLIEEKLSEATEVGKAGPAKLVSYGPKGDKVTASKIAAHLAKRANDYSGANAELVKKLSSEVAKHGDTTANELIGKHKAIAKNVGMDAKAAHNLISGAASALKEEVQKENPKEVAELDEASDSKIDKAMAIINARITKTGQPPKYPSFDSAPEDIKAAARNLAKNLKESETLDEDAKALFQKIKKHAANLGDKFVQGALHGATFGMMGHDTHDPLTGDAYDKVKPFSNRIKKKKMKESLDEVAIIKNGRKYSNVKWFETEKGANDFLEKNPDFGVIQADKGGVYVANNKNKGTPVK